MSGGSRVTIPSSARKTIQNIREIAGNHSDEEIYSMLQECSMDPNETAQKLLLQDTFHEVKRKRDRRKENNKESADSRWRSGPQGRGGRGVRGNYSSRYVPHDGVVVRNVSIVKENGVNQGTDKGVAPTSAPVTQDSENMSMVAISSSAACLDNDSTLVGHPISVQECISQELDISGSASMEKSSAVLNKTGIPPPGDVTSCTSRKPAASAEQFLLSTTTQVSASGVDVSDSIPVLVPSLDALNPGLVGAIKHEVGGQQSAVEATINKIVSHDVVGSELSSISGKGSSEMSHSYIHGKMHSKGHEASKLQDTSQFVSSSSLSGSIGSRLSSNYSRRSHQQNSSQRAVGPTKDWKPKANVSSAQVSGALRSCDVEGEAVAWSQPASSSTIPDNSTLQLQNKLQELQFSEAQHVIIPNHLQVPESERTGLSFGSFDANFVVSTRSVNDPDSDKSSTHLSDSSLETEENANEPSSPSSNNQIPPAAAEEAEYPETCSPDLVQESLPSREPDLSNISAVPEHDQSKPEAALPPEGLRFSVVHTAPIYSNFGIVPQMLGSQFATFEGVGPQSRDASRLTSFVVQQPFDHSTNFYTQIYRPNADGDGHFSPPAPGAATKYNGNVAVLPAQTGQSLQESADSLVLPSTVPIPLGTQAVGVVQSSVTANQPPLAVFRQPAGVHISHFPPNFIPYNQYFSPFYGPPPTIHHFLSNTPFPQQPPAGSIYPPPPAAAGAAPVKYSLSQYKPTNNTGNPIALPTGYGSYSSTPAYSHVTSGNSTGSEDLTSSHYKENNVYMNGQQQSEGSAVWIPATGRDISALQASSFYNLPQGPHMNFAPTQGAQGAFTGIYHPAQSVAAGTVHPLLQQSQGIPGAVEMAGSTAGAYQQPQRAQMNWANNYQ